MAGAGATGRTRTLDISPLGRVEGDLDVRVEVADGVVVNAWTHAELFRGFEMILRDKDPQAGLVVTPRICGICGAAQLTCAAWALDTAWATRLPRNAILARNLGQLAEMLQSQIRHFYVMFAPDLAHANYRRSPYHGAAVKRFAPYTGTSYELGVTTSGKPVELYALFGGQWPHSSYMVPGGVMCAPTLSDVTRARAVLEFVRTSWLEPCWLGCSLARYEQIRSYDDFMVWLEESPAHAGSDLGLFWRMGLNIGLARYGRGLERYLAWGGLPHEDRYQQPTIEGRAATLILPGGVLDARTGELTAADPDAVRENTTHAWYDEGSADVSPWDRTTRPAADVSKDFEGRYSWSTAVTHDAAGRLEVGPLARQLIGGSANGEPWQQRDPLLLDMFRRLGGASVLLRQFARMHELAGLYRQAEHCLREFQLKEPWYIKPTQTDGRGWGATEAVRGSLAHWVEIEAGRIRNYQVVAPTTWNVGPRDGRGVPGPIEQALLGTPIADPEHPVEVGHVARSFDSCMVCTVHAHDAKSGRELARFRVA